MPKSVFTDAHQILIEILISARRESGLRQAELAELVGKNQSYISNIERGQRRIDALEFYVIARAMGKDPVNLYKNLVERLPDNIEI